MELLKIKEAEAAQATEAAQKLLQNIKEMQVTARKKDDKVGRLKAEAGNAKKRVLTLDGELLEMHSLIKEKKSRIQKLEKGQPESLKRKCACSVSNETSQECRNDKHEMDLEEYTICVKIHDGKIIDLEVLDSDTIYDVKARIEDKEGIPACQQRLMLDDKPLLGSCTLKDYYIWMELSLTLHLQGMHIFVNDIGLGKTMTFEVEKADTVYSVMAKIFDETGVAPVRQLLYFAREMLEEDHTLADYNIQNESTLDFWITFPLTDLTDTNRIRILVQTETGRTVIEYYALESEKVGSIKAKIHAMSPIPLDQQCLFLRGKLLENDCTMAFYGINGLSRSCILLLQLRLPGS